MSITTTTPAHEQHTDETAIEVAHAEHVTTLEQRFGLRKYRLTIALGFGLPMIHRFALATSAEAAAAEYEHRTGGRCVLAEIV